MKSIIPFIVMTLIVVAASYWSCVNRSETNLSKKNQSNVEYPEEYKETSVFTENVEEINIDKQRPSREVAIQEVLALWNMHYDDEGIRKNHKKRKRFLRYAQSLVDAVRFYQDNKVNIGGQLPKDQHTHLVVATMVALETGVNHRVIGKSHGEVGLLQIHGKGPLNGHSRGEVRRNPTLGLLLGVRWLAFHTQFCKKTRKGIDNWAKPLSLYGAGLSRGRKRNGTCKEISVARKRVRLAKFYRTRIRNKSNS
jgi:hypothetical protein